jgi:membrane associated rhomboid family serine protease
MAAMIPSRHAHVRRRTADRAGVTSSTWGPGTAVRVTPSRRHAEEWAVVLASAGIAHWQRHRVDGWALLVLPGDAGAALAALDAYDRENAPAEPVAADAALARPAVVVGVAVALLLALVFVVAGPRAGRGAWFAAGSADATRMLDGEWWRAVTALTLHADARHLLGNAVTGVLLVVAVCRQLGAGLGLWLLLLAGAGGNALTAAAHGGGHVSVGASTALFGALGLLAALRIAPGRVGARARRAWVVGAASLLLLALFGVGPEVDILAHLFGFLAGGGLGLLATRALLRLPPPPAQWVLLGLAGLSVAGAWILALFLGMGAGLV